MSSGGASGAFGTVAGDGNATDCGSHSALTLVGPKAKHEQRPSPCRPKYLEVTHQMVEQNKLLSSCLCKYTFVMT